MSGGAGGKGWWSQAGAAVSLASWGRKGEVRKVGEWKVWAEEQVEVRRLVEHREGEPGPVAWLMPLTLLLAAQVKMAYVNFVNHCYVDTEVEMKEIYTSNHIWTLFENFTLDMARVCLREGMGFWGHRAGHKYGWEPS